MLTRTNIVKLRELSSVLPRTLTFQANKNVHTE